MPAVNSLTALLALALAWQGAVAYPRFWYDRKYLASQGYATKDGYDWSVFPDDGTNCSSYPDKAYTGFFPAHGMPYLDSAIGMSFTRSDGTNVASLCPGAKHTVKVSFPIKRLALLVTSPDHAVHFSSPAPATSSCPGRIDLGMSKNSNAASSFTATFTVPCSAATANGSTVVFTVNSAGTEGATRRWAQAHATVPIAPESAPECAAAAAVCASGGSGKMPMPSGSGGSGPGVATHKPPPAMGGRRNPPPTRRPPPHRG